MLKSGWLKIIQCLSVEIIYYRKLYVEERVIKTLYSKCIGMLEVELWCVARFGTICTILKI